MDETAGRGRLPKLIAVINVDRCTGCEACRETCPVDCIQLIQLQPPIKGIHAWCEVDVERCIGCRLCVRHPRRKSSTYELKVCPWDAIEMVPAEFLPQAIADMGGPPEYATANRARQLAAAERLLARKQPQTRSSQ